jgi:hypothetical protein
MMLKLNLVPQLRSLIGGIVNQQRTVSDVAGGYLKLNVFCRKLAFLFHHLISPIRERIALTGMSRRPTTLTLGNFPAFSQL